MNDVGYSQNRIYGNMNSYRIWVKPEEDKEMEKERPQCVRLYINVDPR